MQLEVLLAEKVENLRSVTIELEKTQKTLRFLNNSTSKLDHLITTGKSFDDHSGVGYKGESSSSKTIFVKSVVNLVQRLFNVFVKKTCYKICCNRKQVCCKAVCCNK